MTALQPGIAIWSATTLVPTEYRVEAHRPAGRWLAHQGNSGRRAGKGAR
jgi:hypothetical protein